MAATLSSPGEELEQLTRLSPPSEKGRLHLRPGSCQEGKQQMAGSQRAEVSAHGGWPSPWPSAHGLQWGRGCAVRAGGERRGQVTREPGLEG